MTERKEPTLGASSDLPERDARPARPARPASATPSASAAARPSAAIRAAQAQDKSVSGLTLFALLIAIAALGGSGFLAWQAQQAKEQNAYMRSMLEARIAELEGKLTMTEGEAMESSAAFKAKLVWADSEIRKLWGVSYDTNRKNIEENKNAIAALTKQLDKTNASLLADVKKQLGSVDGKFLAAQATVDEQVSRIQSQMDKLAGLEKQFGTLRNDLSGRIKLNEEAVKAIDVYRLSINRDLRQLQERVNTLQPK